MLYGLGAVALWSTVATAFELAFAVMAPVALLLLHFIVGKPLRLSTLAGLGLILGGLGLQQLQAKASAEPSAR